jgi:TonB family protein
MFLDGSWTILCPQNSEFDKITYFYSNEGLYFNAYQIELNGLGDLLYYNYEYQNREAGYKGRLSNDLLIQIFEKYKKIPIKNLKAEYSGVYVLDGAYEVIIFDVGHKSIQVEGLGYEDEPIEIRELIYKLLESCKSTMLELDSSVLHTFSYNFIEENKKWLDSLESSLASPTSVINENDDLLYYFVSVEEMPEPIGGISSIQSKIVYPDSARNANVEGKVFITVYIDEIGRVNKVELLKGIGFGCDEIAMKAVQNSLFKPGKQRGIPVKVQVIIPIVFRK